MLPESPLVEAPSLELARPGCCSFRTVGDDEVKLGRTATLIASLLVSLLIVGGSSATRLAPPAACRMSQLAVTLGPYISEATEQHTLALRLVNHGKQACVLYGYPRVTLYDRRGVIPFRFSYRGDQMISARPPKPIRVPPGGAAFLLLNKNTCVNGFARAATTVKIAAPGAPATGVTSFSFSRKMPFSWRVPDSCADATDPGSVITVSPFVETVRAALTG